MLDVAMNHIPFERERQGDAAMTTLNDDPYTTLARAAEFADRDPLRAWTSVLSVELVAWKAFVDKQQADLSWLSCQKESLELERDALRARVAELESGLAALNHACNMEEADAERWRAVVRLAVKEDHVCIERPEPAASGETGEWRVVCGDPISLNNLTEFFGDTAGAALDAALEEEKRRG
jgi:cell division protein FtsB